MTAAEMVYRELSGQSSTVDNAVCLVLGIQQGTGSTLWSSAVGHGYGIPTCLGFRSVLKLQHA